MKEDLAARLWRGFWILGVYIRFTWNANSRDVPFKYSRYKTSRETSHWFWRFNWETFKMSKEPCKKCGGSGDYGLGQTFGECWDCDGSGEENLKRWLIVAGAVVVLAVIVGIIDIVVGA